MKRAKTEGTAAERAKTEGTAAERAKTEGTAAERAKTEGTSAERTKTEGTAAERAKTEGTATEEINVEETITEKIKTEKLLQESSRFRRRLIHLLLRIRFLITGFLTFIAGMFLGAIPILSRWDSPLTGTGWGVLFGIAAALFISTAVIRFVTGYYKEDLGIRSLKTLDYDRFDEIFQKLSTEEIGRESRRFYTVFYSLAIPVLAGYLMIHTFFMRAHDFPVPGFFTIYIFLLSIFHIYIGMTGRFYLIEDFQPGGKK